MDLFTNTGIFLYPLAACSFIAVFITVERLIALRNSVIIPRSAVDAFVSSKIDQLQPEQKSAMGDYISIPNNKTRQ